MADIDHKVWNLAKLCDSSLKEHLKEKGDGSDSVGYSVDVGRYRVTYKPACSYTVVEWGEAIRFLVDNRQAIWNFLKENGKIPREVLSKVEYVKTNKEEVSIK